MKKVYFLLGLMILCFGCVDEPTHIDRIQEAYDFGKTTGYQNCIDDIQSGRITVKDGMCYRTNK